MTTASPRLIPLWIKIAYTIFIAIIVPVYLRRYGPTNFLYFCNVAFFATLVGIWLENAVILSATLVGIFLPQMLWVADFLVEIASHLGVFGGRDVHLTGMTTYMFRPPYFLRVLSLYHGWLPFLLIWLVWRVGYDKRAVLVCTGVMWVLLTVCYAWMPPPCPVCDPDHPGIQLRHPDQPVNINYVYNLTSDDEPQSWIEDQDLYFTIYMVALVVLIYVPTHFLFSWLMPGPRSPLPPG